MRVHAWLATAMALALCVGCGEGGGGSTGPDSAILDGGIGDTGVPPDAGTGDTGTPDAAAPDAGTPDTGTPDTGTSDTGTPDAGTPDAGTPDTGATDAAAPDAGNGDGGSGCSDDCGAEGLSRCAGGIVQTCMTGPSGCLEYLDGDDCTTTAQVCEDDGGTAMCVGGGGSCAAPVRTSVAGAPIVVTGETFFVDFTDDLELGGTGCTTRSGTAEALFAVELEAGQQVLVRELGPVDVVTSVLPGACGDAMACAVSEDFDEADGHVYQATAAETVYVVIEEYSAESLSAYEISIAVGEPEVCGDAADNDGDGLTDCDDTDCFGFDPDCTAEANCTDGEDNDGDGLTDCDDMDDCGGDPLCAPASGAWERFGSDNRLDLEGHTLAFTPNPADPPGYTWAVSPGVTDFPEPPGTGTATATLTLGDDDAAEHVLTELTAVSFFGVDYGSLWIGSNGYITFGDGDGVVVFDLSRFFALPRIAPLATDLDPSSGGTITVDEFADRVVVTYEDVPAYGDATATGSFQAVIQNDGTIELHYVSLGLPDDGFVGVGDGLPNEPFPDMVRFLMLPLSINEVVYDDPAADDMEFVELMGEPTMDLTGHTVVHFNGNGGGALFTMSLDGLTMPDDGFLVIADSAVANLDLDKGSATLQNGAESVALYRDWDPGAADGTLVDAVAWGMEDPVPGEGEPAPEIERDDWNNSIGRYPDGADTDDNATDFVQSWWPTPGLPNRPAQPESTTRMDAAALAAGGTFPAAIPDNDPAGISLAFDSPAFASGTIEDVQVGVRIVHPWRGDLAVRLTSPGGTEVLLHDGTGADADDLMTVYDLATAPEGDLDTFDGEVLDGTGTWTLMVSDNGLDDTGEVVDFVVWVQVN